jgi:hypothetical protein
MLKVLFTDLDGTCVHYDWHTFGRIASEPTDRGLFSCTSLDGKQDALLLQLPPSTSGKVGLRSRARGGMHAAADTHRSLWLSFTGAQGVISVETLRLYAALRQLGIRIVVITGRHPPHIPLLPHLYCCSAQLLPPSGISLPRLTSLWSSCAGARLVTLLARLPFIPAADAFVCEGGGRIFYPAGSSLDCPSAAPLMEDMGWRRQQAGAAGPPGQDTVPPEQRSGGLWRFYGALKAQAPQLHVDAVSYTTAFRVKGPEDAVAAALSVLPEGLTTALNLGAADVFPLTSGKVLPCLLTTAVCSDATALA